MNNLLVPIYKLYLKTLRIETLGHRPDHSVYLFWHSKFFALLEVLKNKRGKILISPSRDGKFVSTFVKAYNFGIIESSYRKERFKGAMDIIQTYKKENLSVGIVPDGPLGPRYTIKEELFHLLKKLEAHITLVGVGYSKHIKLNTWDRFEIPKPFGSVLVLFSNYKIEDFENHLQLQKKLIDINEMAEKLSSQ